MSPRRKLLIILTGAIVSWMIVFAIAYGVIALFS